MKEECLMTPSQNQRSRTGWDLTAAGGVVAIMALVFTALEYFSFIGQPLGAFLLGAILTAMLVGTGKISGVIISIAWLGMSFVLLLYYVLTSHPATVKGSLEDGNGSPIPGLRLMLHDVTGVTHQSLPTNENGEFRFLGIPEGVFEIWLASEKLVARKFPSDLIRIINPEIDVGELTYRPGSVPPVTPSPTDSPVPLPTQESSATSTSQPESTPVPSPIVTQVPPTPVEATSTTMTPTTATEERFKVVAQKGVLLRPDPKRVGIVEDLPNGTVLTVRGDLDPVRGQEDGLLWWPVSSPDGGEGWVAEWQDPADAEPTRLIKPIIGVGDIAVVANPLGGQNARLRSDCNNPGGHLLPQRTEMKVLEGPGVNCDVDAPSMAQEGREWWRVEARTPDGLKVGWVADFSSDQKAILVAPPWYVNGRRQAGAPN
jgi:hypothetical protein